jgi:hypothetical protein
MMAHDRSDSGDFPMTQDFMAMMLCAHLRHYRSYWAAAAEEHIRAERGREGFVEAVCECDGMVRSRFEALLGTP